MVKKYYQNLFDDSFLLNDMNHDLTRKVFVELDANNNIIEFSEAPFIPPLFSFFFQVFFYRFCLSGFTLFAKSF